MKNKATMEEIRNHAEEHRDTDPVYWGEILRTIDRGFKRPDDKEYRQWLRTLEILNGRRFDDEMAWELTDDCVRKTKDGRTECYPVVFGAFAPVRISTPNLSEAIADGHLLLGFVTVVNVGAHPNSDDGEPALSVDEAFVLPCWKSEDVEPMLRGCFLYA